MRIAILLIIALLAMALISPAGAEAPTLVDRIEHIESDLASLREQLEYCIPATLPMRIRGRTVHVITMNSVQKKFCFAQSRR